MDTFGGDAGRPRFIIDDHRSTIGVDGGAHIRIGFCVVPGRHRKWNAGDFLAVLEL